MSGERETIPESMRVQWWLVELDRYGNVKAPLDGAHSEARGAHHAAYLNARLGFTNWKRLAVARIELYDAVPDATGANEEALDTLAALVRATDNSTEKG